jgi:hypothetical protein
VTGIYQYPGRFLNDDGFISGFNFLQNKNYYQNFSYVVRLNAPLKDYKQALLSLTHPAGTKLFGEFLYEDNQPSTNGASALTSTYRTVFLRGTYVTAANGSNSNVSVFVTSHGLSANANVYLEFLTGDTSNITNGLFMIRSSNTNYFYVGHANNSNTSGNVMAGIIV